MVDVETTSLEARPELAALLTRMFAGGTSPPSVEELREVRLLTTSSWPNIWKPDQIESLRFHWQQLTIQRDPNVEAVSKELERVMSAPENRLEPSLPRAFYRYSNQRNVAAFPYWRTQDCSVPGIDNERKKELEQAGFTVEQFMEFATQQRFAIVRDWLVDLPIKASDKVYVAHAVDDTMTMPWHTFAQHWNSFRGGSGNHVNLVSGKADWYLFFHRDDYAVFGCTESCAREHGMAIDMARFGSDDAFLEDLRAGYYGEGNFFDRTFARLVAATASRA